MSDNVSEPLDRARAGRILPEGNVSPYLIVIGGVFVRIRRSKCGGKWRVSLVCPATKEEKGLHSREVV
jgi:hypothetical protein